MSNRVPITAIVVSCDEAELLKRCLPALAFCDELIVVDMECTDATVAVARQHGARVAPHARAPVIEAAQQWMSTIATHAWILSIDPDEVVDKALAVEINHLLGTLPENVAVVEMPIQFYFGSQALRGTYWGGPNWKKGSLFHRDRVELGAIVHRKAMPKAGMSCQRMPWSEHAVIHHYWMQDYRQFMEKHRRYIAAEGERHRSLGRHFGWLRMAWATAHSFAWSLVKKAGWRDGMTGVGLSAFYAWYVWAGWMELRRLEIGKRRAGLM